jgi:hypothetical protein
LAFSFESSDDGWGRHKTGKAAGAEAEVVEVTLQATHGVVSATS